MNYHIISIIVKEIVCMGHMPHDPIGQVGQSEYVKVVIVSIFSNLFCHQ